MSVKQLLLSFVNSNKPLAFITDEIGTYGAIDFREIASIFFDREKSSVTFIYKSGYVQKITNPNVPKEKMKQYYTEVVKLWSSLKL